MAPKHHLFDQGLKYIRICQIFNRRDLDMSIRSDMLELRKRVIKMNQVQEEKLTNLLETTREIEFWIKRIAQKLGADDVELKKD